MGAMVLDPHNARLIINDQIITEQGPQRLLSSVDLYTGDRYTITSTELGTGPLLGNQSLAFDSVLNRAYVAYGYGVLAGSNPCCLSPTEVIIKIILKGPFIVIAALPDKHSEHAFGPALLATRYSAHSRLVGTQSAIWI